MSAEYKEIDLGLNFDLAIGVRGYGDVKRAVELLKGNGISEKVFLKRLADKPYTWIGNVLTIAIKSLEGEDIAKEAREEYIKETSVTIPAAIKRMPLADANTCLLEIHRRLWQNLVPHQQCQCKFCGNAFVMDIDLNRIDHTDESKQFIEELLTTDSTIELVADLVDGYDFVPFQKNGNDGFKMEEYRGSYNRLVYRAPTLGDAILNEKFVKDDVVFWRRLAYDCLLRIENVSERNTDVEEVIMTLPKEVNTFLGTRLYDNFLSSKDLKQIRTTLREKLPVMPFSYEETCPSCDRSTPIAIEASSFFSA
jgi:hypothetical protein